jgi:hypothetical protein
VAQAQQSHCRRVTDGHEVEAVNRSPAFAKPGGSQGSRKEQNTNGAEKRSDKDLEQAGRGQSAKWLWVGRRSQGAERSLGGVPGLSCEE